VPTDEVSVKYSYPPSERHSLSAVISVLTVHLVLCSEFFLE